MDGKQRLVSLRLVSLVHLFLNQLFRYISAMKLSKSIVGCISWVTTVAILILIYSKPRSTGLGKVVHIYVCLAGNAVISFLLFQNMSLSLLLPSFQLYPLPFSLSD